MEEKTPNLLPLHPRDLSDEEFSAYEVEFEKVLNDRHCRNIALSGPYGAGKSSVIRKVEKRQKGRGEKWITVSLATFGGTGKTESATGESTQSAVESEILRQMVHKVGISEAPKSRFRKLGDRGRRIDAALAALILVFALLTTYLFKHSDALLSLRVTGAEGVALAAWVIIAAVGLYHLIRTNSISKMIKRVKLFETELEITPSDSKSPYEHCVDEVVYLLNASKVDVVVLEDLDRFGSIEIFEKMRSLNALANDSRFCDIKNDEAEKPLRFFYLMRDGLFENPHDRTKFFDYIIPVVPYADPNNALNIMRNALNGVGLSADEGFLFQLSSYIDDPRIIHDIANEAYHYKKTLFEERSFDEGDPERLVALLAYKALFPRDFELLQAGRGYMHEVLNGKQRLIAELEMVNDDEGVELRRELDSIDQQLQISEDEAICMFGGAELSEISRHLGAGYSSKKFEPHAFLKAARDNNWASQSLESLMENLKENDRYQARIMEVRGDANRRSEIIRAQLKKLEAQSDAWCSMNIRQLIEALPDANALFIFESDDIERGEDFEELSMGDVLSSPFFPMLRFLVSSGYIDESYRRYISNFYSDALCAEDDDYLSTIKQAKPVDLNYKPKSPGEIVRRMDQGMFARKSNWNPWIVSALFDIDDEWKIDAFMSSVKRSDGVRYLARFAASEQFNPRIIDWMFTYFDDPVVELLVDQGISADDKRCFCKRYLVYGKDVFLPEEEGGAFAKYINSDPCFLEKDARFDDAIIGACLLQVGYRAEAIDFSCASETLLNYVYDNHLFMPEASIIDGYLSFKHGIDGSMSRGVLITEALKLSNGPIKDVVSGDMEYFVSSVIRSSKVSLKDDSEIVVAVLNKESVLPKTAKLYIGALEGIEVEEISQVHSPEHRNGLLAAQLVKCNAGNVILFYQWANNSIGDDLAKLIEAKGAPTDLGVAKCEEAGVDEADIVSKIIECSAISLENKKVIIDGCGFAFAAFDIGKLDDETILAMIDANAIEMNKEMLDDFRSNKPALTLDYILSNVDKFLAVVDADASDGSDGSIAHDEVAGLLGSDIEIGKKLRALSYYPGTIRLNEKYGNEINAAIMEGHFDLRDMVNLSSYYENATGKYKDQIAKMLADRFETVISEEIEIGWDLMSDSLRYLKDNRLHALRFLSWYCEKYGDKKDRDRVTKCFQSAGLKDYSKLIEGSQTMIPASDYDNAMLSSLFKLGMCGTISASINAMGLRKVYPKGHKRTK